MRFETEHNTIKIQTKIGDIFIKAHPLENSVKIMVEQDKTMLTEMKHPTEGKTRIVTNLIEIFQVFDKSE